MTRITMNVYNKPKLEIALSRYIALTSYPAYQYTHRISAVGGFDTASCVLDVSQAEGERIYTEMVGNRVAFFASNPLVPIWEGYINRVTIEVGGIISTRSMDEMANVIYTVYWDTSSSPNTKMTTLAANAASGAAYGFKSKAIDIGTQYSSGAAIAADVQTKELARLAFPPISTDQGGSNEFRISIDLLGFYHTWNWDVFSNSDTTSLTAGQTVFLFTMDNTPTNPLSQTGFNASRWTANNNGNGVFYNDRDFGLWSNNTAFNTTTQKEQGTTHWQKISQIVEAGDGSNNWVIGITPTDPNLNYRRAYYALADTTVNYFTNVYGDRRIRNPAGGIVQPYEVLPNCSIVLQDFLSTYNLSGEDPRVAYIESVEYDGESNVVNWTTDDDVSLTGLFQLKRQNRATDSRFGAPERPVYY